MQTPAPQSSRRAQRAARRTKRAMVVPLVSAVVKAANHSGVMVALFLPPEAATQLYAATEAAGLAPELINDMHLTLVYPGNTDDLAGSREQIAAFCALFAAEAPVVAGTVGGIGRFLHDEGDGTNALYASFDSPGLSLLRGELLTGLIEAGLIDPEQSHDFTPHITLAYIPSDDPTPELDIGGIAIGFDFLHLAWGGERTAYPLQPGVATKAADDTAGGKPTSGGGYGARAGQTIRGRLVRGNDGKFSSAGAAPAKPSAPKPPPSKPKAGPKPAPKLPPKAPAVKRLARRAARAAAKPKAPAKSRAPVKPAKAKAPTADRAAISAEKRAANRATVAQALGATLAPAAFAALADFADGKDADPAQMAVLAKAGLAEQAEDGTFRLSPQGRTFMDAANAGDTRRAADAVSKAADLVAGRATAARTRAQRAIDRAARAAKKKPAEDKPAEDKPVKPTAGGGSGKPKKPVPPPQAGASAATNKLTEAATRLSEGQPLTADEEAALIRNGYARRDRDGNLSLTAAGRRSYTEKAAPLTVFKDHAGRYRWLAISSSAYRDRDGEIVTRKALADDCARADASGKQTPLRVYGPLRWWHFGSPDPLPGMSQAPWGPGLDIGVCDFNAMSGPFLVESGTFTDERWGPIVQKMAPALGISLAFYHMPKTPDQTYPQIRKFERSLLPVGKESNLFTGLAIIGGPPVDSEKIIELKELAGADGAAMVDDLLAQVPAIEAAAAAQGIAQKAAAIVAGAVGPDSGVTIKAAAPMDEAMDDTAAADEAIQDAAEDEAAVIFDDDEQAAIRSIVEEAIKAAMAQGAAIATKAADTQAASWAIAQKAQADLAAEVIALKAQVKDLEEDAPAAFQLPALRPSQSTYNVINADVAASLKSAKPAPDPLAPLLDHIMPGG